MIRLMLGYFMISLPFIVLFIVIWRVEGLKDALGIYATVAAIVLFIYICLTAGLAILH